MQRVLLTHGPVYYLHGGEGFPLLLLHGWGGSSRYWKETITACRPFRSVYALDMPGYGHSPPLTDPASAERLARIIIEFADTLNLDQFDLNAHSFGASVAAYLVAHYPQRVRRLILTCFSTFQNEFERRMVDQMMRQMGLSLAMWQPWMSLWHPWTALWQSWMTLWRPRMPGHMPSIYQTIAWRFFYTVPSDEALLQEGFEDFLRMDQRTSLESIISALHPSITTALQAITIPTLLVAARQDMIMPPSGVPVVQELIPNCHLHWIEHCGHVPMIEKPEAYHQIIHNFLLGEGKFA
jgi:pimeloyl-ACP methyl ester carboxylesterase